MTDPTPDVPTLRREWCREELGDGERCPDSAEFILWGKLFPEDAFGPRCYAHAVKHTHHDMPARCDQWAVYDLRALPGILDRLEAAEGAVARVEALDFESVIDEHFVMWHEMGGIDEPPGEWRCQCGLKFGFSHTAVQHVATTLRAALAEVTP